MDPTTSPYIFWEFFWRFNLHFISISDVEKHSSKHVKKTHWEKIIMWILYNFMYTFCETFQTFRTLNGKSCKIHYAESIFLSPMKFHKGPCLWHLCWYWANKCGNRVVKHELTMRLSWYSISKVMLCFWCCNIELHNQ